MHSFQAGNMLSDHMASRYYEGLLEVKAIRAAKQHLPSWVGFADDCTWYVDGGREYSYWYMMFEFISLFLSFLLALVAQASSPGQAHRILRHRRPVISTIAEHVED